MPNPLEDPTPIIFTGIVIMAVLGAFFLRTRQGKLLVAMGVVLGLTLLGVLVEHLVVTEREQVEATLYGAAAALEANDLDRLFKHVSESAEQPRRMARWALGIVEVVRIHMRNVEIQINQLTSPPTARVNLEAMANIREPTGTYPYRHTPWSQFVVEMRLEGDRWVISDVSDVGASPIVPRGI